MKFISFSRLFSAFLIGLSAILFSPMAFASTEPMVFTVSVDAVDLHVDERVPVVAIVNKSSLLTVRHRKRQPVTAQTPFKLSSTYDLSLKADGKSILPGYHARC